MLQHPFPLCFQQSTGDSAAPEVDVVLRVLWDLLVDDDVCYLDPPAGLERAMDLLHDGQLVGVLTRRGVGTFVQQRSGATGSPAGPGAGDATHDSEGEGPAT